MDSSNDSVGIDVPESLLVSKRRSPSMQNDTRISVDLRFHRIAISSHFTLLMKRTRG
jgi:hypothetical protein